MAEELNITIRAKDEASATVDKLSSSLKGAGDAAKKAEESAGGFSAKTLALGAAAGAAVTAAAGLAAAFGAVDAAISAASAGLERGGFFNDLSLKVGVSVEQLSRMEVAAAASGVSMETLATSFKFLQKNMVEAAQGSEQQVAAFASLGVAVTDAQGKLRDTNEVLLDAADAIAQMEPSAARTAVTLQVFGRAGTEMLPFLLEGREGLERFAQANDALGLTLTTGTAAALDTVGDSMAVLGLVGEGISQQFAAGLAPALQIVTDQLVQFVSQVGIGDGTIRGFGDTVGNLLRGAFESLRDQVIEIKEIFTTLEFDEAMAVMGGKLDRALQTAFETAIWAAARAAKNVFLTAVDWVFGSVDVGAVAKTKNEELIRTTLADLQKQITDQYGRDPNAAQSAAQFDASTRNTLAAIDQLKGRLGELKGEQLVAAAATAQHAGAMQDQQIAANLDALGIGKTAESFRFYETAGVRAVDTTKKNSDASKEHAGAKAAEKSAVEQATEAVEKASNTLQQATELQQARTAAIQQGIEAGDSYAQIQSDVEQAELAVEAAQKLATGATLESVAAWVKEKEAAGEAGDAAEKAAAQFAAIKQVESLKEEAAIWEKVRDKIITVEEAHKQLAVAKEKDKGLTKEQAEEVVNLTDHVEELRGKYDEVAETGIDTWSQIDDAFGQMMDGLIQGTLDMGDIWKSFVTAMLNEFVKGAGGISGILGQLVGNFGSLLSGGGGGGGGGLLGSLFGAGSGGGISGLGALVSLGASFVFGGGLGPLANQGGSNALSLGSSSLSLLNSGVSGLQGLGFLSGSGGLMGALFGEGAASTTLGSLIGETGSGIVGSLFGEAGSSVLGTTLGTLGNVVGAAGAFVGGGMAAWQLGQGDFSAASILGLVAATAAAINYLPVIGQIIYAVIVAITAIVSALTDITPTKGTLQRRIGEMALDQTPTFAELQKHYGDLTREKNNLGANPNLLGQREYLGEKAMQDIQGFAAIFAERVFGRTENGTYVAQMAFQWSNILTDFFSRMEGESAEVSKAVKENLLSAFKDLGIRDAAKAFEILNDAAAHFIYPPGNFKYLEEQVDSANLLGAAIRGVGAVFESELPKGVHIAELALESMKNTGVRAFDNLDTTGKETLLNLVDDAENFDKVVAKLFKDGFTIDVDEFRTRLKDIVASASFIGDNIGAIFTAPSVTSGIAQMGEQLRQTIVQAVSSKGMEQLFDTTNIAASFEPVFAVLRRLQEGDFDLTTKMGGESFQTEIVAAIAQGKANLEDYIPQLRAIRDATEEVNKAIEEALKPTEMEQFWEGMTDRIKENQDAIEGMAGSIFDVASKAELLQPGSGKEAARASVDQVVDEAALRAAQAGAADFATKSPQGEALAKLTTEFQYKVAAAMQDGIITAQEKADLTRLKAKMDEAGKVLADSVSGSAGTLSDLFRADRLKEAIEGATAALKGAVGTAAGSMFDVIKGGGSTEEGIKAFGESFRNSVRDNVLQGMQEALVQSVIMEGALGTLMGQLKQAVSVAMSDGMIDADEQAFIDGLAKGIGTATDSALTALEPTLNALGQTAQVVAGNADKAQEDVKDLNDKAKGTSDQLDEMGRRAAKALEGVGDAVSEDVTGGIKDGINALSTALEGEGGAGGVDGIADGVNKMVDALGGGTGSGSAPDAIKDGLQKLQDAFGPDVPADQMKATLEKLGAALGSEQGDALASSFGSLKDAMGEGDSGLAATVGSLAQAMGADGLVSATEQAFAALAGDSGIAGAAEEAGGALRDGLGNLGDGMTSAGDAFRSFADLIRSFQLPKSAKGGTFGNRGMSIVGEEGIELVVANPDGGFTVIPVNGTPHAADGISMDASGGATTIPLRGLPMMANGGSIGGSGSITLGLSPLMDAADLVVDGLRSMAAALDDARSSASSAATGLDSVATSSTSAAETQGGLIGAPHVPGSGGRPEWPSYTPITTDQLEPEDFARIDETYKGLTGLFDRLFSSKDFTDKVLNSDDVDANDRVLQLIRQLQITAGDGQPGAQDPFLNGDNRAPGLDPGYLSPNTTVNDVRWYAKLLEEVGQKEFVDYLHARRVNAELFQESQEQVVPGGGPLPPVDYLEYSAKVEEFFKKYGGGDGQGPRADIGPMDFKVREEGFLTAQLDPSKIESSITLSLEEGVKAFAAGGSIEDLRESINTSVNESMYNGLVDGMIAAIGIEEQEAILSAAVQDAMSDGFLDAADVDSLKTLAGEVAGKLSGSVEAMGPAFAAIADAFGIDLRNASTEAMTASADAIGGALRGALNDPSKLTMENVTKALKAEIYQSVSQGLIDAFIQSAVIQGALAVPMGIIQQAFAAVSQGQMSAAEANVAIAQQVASILEIINGPEFAAMMQPVLDGLQQLAKDLGQTGAAVEDTVPPFQEAAQAAEEACTGECDLEYKLVQAQLGIGNLTNAGGAGVFGVEYYAPERKFARGGFVRGSARGVPGIFGEAGDEVVLPLDGAEAQAALAAAAAGFARAAAGTGAGEANEGREQEWRELSDALKAQLQSSKEDTADLRAALAEVVGTLAARPVSVEIDGQRVATAVVNALEDRSRGGRSSLDRVR